MVLRDRARLIVGSIGLGLALTGLGLFIQQMLRSLSAGRLESVPVRAVFNEPVVRHNVPPAVTEWFQHIATALGIHDFLLWSLDEFPLALVLIVLGTLIAWRSLLAESSASRGR